MKATSYDYANSKICEPVDWPAHKGDRLRNAWVPVPYSCHLRTAFIQLYDDVYQAVLGNINIQKL